MAPGPRGLNIFSPKEKAKGYYCYRAIINFDTKTKMPIRVRIYDWDESLVEEITDMKTLNWGRRIDRCRF